jgi:glycosyltransferase involved in cell wall biosynthesis
MSANNLVSIITPCYNSEKFIGTTINSVLDQSYTNWEMIIVDDLSTDNSVKIIEKQQTKDIRIKCIRLTKNSGAAVCRNTAIKIASGRYIAFLDSDDLWVASKLEKQIGFMKANNSVLSFGCYQKIDEAGNLIADSSVFAKEKISYTDMLTSNKIGCLTAMYDANKLGKVYMPLIKKRQDYALWLKILKTTPLAHGFEDNLGYYRLRKASVSSSKIEMLKWNWKMFREIEKLSFIKAAYCVFMNVVYKVFK